MMATRAAAMSCLDEETIAAFAESRLPPDRITSLEAHVRTCAVCRELVSLALAAAPAGTGAPLARGSSVGRYTLLALVGRGGMGAVYAAYDPELDRKIALKVLTSDPDAADTRVDSRLLREARAIAKVQHPNVVAVHDVGSIGDRVFIAMEYVDGQTLAAWMSERQRTQQEILDVFTAAGRGLQAAHAAGLVHRDFKPQNVMVGHAGDVRVMDFGLARAVDAPVNPARSGGVEAAVRPDLALTRTGELLGTPLYMSAEQFAGQRTDARTDQFSFCVALYQALYGAHPFGAKHLAELMVAVREGRIQPPPAKSAVAPWLRRILLRGLAPRADERYPSMAELLAALGRDRTGRRRRWITLAAAPLLLAGIATGSSRLTANRPTCDGGTARAATAWTPARRDTIARAFLATGSDRGAQAMTGAAALLDSYVAHWRDLFKETCEATRVRGDQSTEVLDLRMSCLDEGLASVRALADTLASADAAVVDRAVSAAAALPTLDRCSDVPALRAIVRPPDDQATRRRVADLKDRIVTVAALASAGRCDQAMRLGRPTLEAAKQIGYLPLQAEAAFALGRRFNSCADSRQAVADTEDAFMFAETSHYDEIAIEAAAALAGAYGDRLRDARAAHQWLRLAEAILARFPGHPLLEAKVTASRALVFFGEGRLEDALYQNRRALALQERLLGPSSVDVSITVNNIALALHELGRDEEAEASIRRVLDITRSTFGDDSGQMAVAAVNECEILTELKQFAGAHKAVAKALGIWRRQDAGDFLIGYGLLDQGKLELAERQPALAIPTLKKALSILQGQNPRFEAEARFALARALVAGAPGNDGRAALLVRDARAAVVDDPSAARLLRDIERWQHAPPAP
jgi:tetratricopeptide (TPR) repeat protein